MSARTGLPPFVAVAFAVVLAATGVTALRAGVLPVLCRFAIFISYRIEAGATLSLGGEPKYRQMPGARA
jgi:hypothetical protein